MEKKRLEIIITVILSIIFIAVLANAIFAVSKKTKAINVRQLPSKGIVPIVVKAPLKEASENNLSWVRDPFSGKLYSSTSEMELRLEGILWDPKMPAAIINGQVVTVGDVLSGGNRIIAIKQDAVVISDGTRKIEIKLGL